MPNEIREMHDLISDSSVVHIGSANPCSDDLEQYVCRMLQSGSGLFHDFYISNSSQNHSFHKSCLPLRESRWYLFSGLTQVHGKAFHRRIVLVEAAKQSKTQVGKLKKICHCEQGLAL
jgi:hypothetical protein